MQLLDLPEIGKSTSVVGFGCGALGARLTSDESLRLLRAAADGGIRHIDVARSYGYGYAEAVVGRLIHGQRDNFFVVSKAGVLPPSQSGVRRFGVAAARRAVRIAPSLRRRVSRRATASIRPALDAPALARSLENTLTALRTDHLDLLLLHECSAADVTDDVVTWLEGVVAQGKAAAWGVATTAQYTADVLATRSPFAINVPSSSSSPNTAVLEVPGPRMRVVHSALGADLRLVGGYLDRPGARAQWEERLGEELSPQALPTLLLRAARGRVPGGVVLASTQRLEHVAAITTAGSAAPDPALATKVEALVNEAARLYR